MSGRTDVNGFATWRNCDALPPGIAWEAPLHPASGWAMRAATARPVAVRRIELSCNICNSCRSVVDPDTRRVTRIVRQWSKTRHPQLLQLTGTVSGKLDRPRSRAGALLCSSLRYPRKPILEAIHRDALPTSPGYFLSTLPTPRMMTRLRVPWVTAQPPSNHITLK